MYLSYLSLRDTQLCISSVSLSLSVTFIFSYITISIRTSQPPLFCLLCLVLPALHGSLDSIEAHAKNKPALCITGYMHKDVQILYYNNRSLCHPYTYVVNNSFDHVSPRWPMWSFWKRTSKKRISPPDTLAHSDVFTNPLLLWRLNTCHALVVVRISLSSGAWNHSQDYNRNFSML